MRSQDPSSLRIIDLWGFKTTKSNKKNIIDLANGKAFSFSQQKTGAEVVIPIMPEIQDVLEKHSYQMQKPVANQVFNRFLKEMCRKAGLTDIVKIKKTEGGVEKTFEYEKCYIVSAHTAKRSFATNLYKRCFPTLMIMAITGHSTEKSFLKYIKVIKEENAVLMLRQLENGLRLKNPNLTQYDFKRDINKIRGVPIR